MRRLHLWKLAALFTLALAYLGLYQFLPPRHRVERFWGESGVNWFGHGPRLAFLYGLALLVLLYSLRYPITTRSASRAGALAWYFLLLASLLPCIWLFVVTDWDNNAVGRKANWIGTPVAMLLVPTAVLVFDVAANVRLPLGVYIGRSLLEIFVLLPLWIVVWVYCEFLLLGWIGV